jgi:hypothetical protein
MRRRILWTKLTPEQCRQRLAAKTGHWLDIAPDRRLQGVIGSSRFMITPGDDFVSLMLKRPSRIAAYGSLSPASEGTRITVRFGPGLAGLVILGIGVGLLIAGIVMWLLHHGPYILFEGLLMTTWLGGIILAASWLAKEPQERLLQSLAKTLEAVEKR